MTKRSDFNRNTVPQERTTLKIFLLLIVCYHIGLVHASFLSGRNPNYISSSWKELTIPSNAWNCYSSHKYHQFRQQRKQQGRNHNVRLFMSSSFDSDDPFKILNLNPTSDKKEIKRAYKRLALKFHPDMVTNKDSTPEEKKKASDTFAKINWAYELLSGKGTTATNGSASSSSGSSGRSTSSAGNRWEPPHRRKAGAYSSSSSSSSYKDWRDYIPNYDASDDYDANGDSFGAIFSDIFAAASSSSSSSSGGGTNTIFRDFVEFLEKNVDGFDSSGSGSYDNDSELRILLQTGSIDDIANEIDDTELIIQQLTNKLNKINDDIIMCQGELQINTNKFTKRIELEEQVDELQARKNVTTNYIKKARKRLLKLQTAYKERIVFGGENDTRAGGRSRSSSSGGRGYGSSYSDNVSKTETTTSGASTSSSSSGVGSRTGPATGSYGSARTDNEEDAWKSEGFGSYGRGRGSNRRRGRTTGSSSSSSSSNRQQQQTSYSSPSSSSSSSSSSSYGNSYDRTQRPSPSSSSSSSSTSQGPPTSTPSYSGDSFVPPHRRRSTDYESRMEADKRRLRELQVDEEFDKLKKELGL